MGWEKVTWEIITKKSFFLPLTIRKFDSKYLEGLKMWRWRRMGKIKWSEKVTNEEVLVRIGEMRNILNNIICRKVNRIGRILRKNRPLHDANEGQMWKSKKNNIRSSLMIWETDEEELKEEVEDQKRCKRQFINLTAGWNRSYLQSSWIC